MGSMTLGTRLMAAFIIATALAACSTPVRYTPGEIASFPEATQEHIRNSDVAIGMSMQAVRYAWGPPGAVSVETKEGGPYEEAWTYTTMRILFPRKLIFRDGKLVEVRTGRRPLPKLLPTRDTEEATPAPAGEPAQTGADAPQ